MKKVISCTLTETKIDFIRQEAEALGISASSYLELLLGRTKEYELYLQSKKQISKK